MNKVFSISLSLLMVAAILHISVAMHYCGGKEVATTVSLSGKLASCGMECSEMGIPVTGTSIDKQCCNDVVKFYGIDSNYIPSFSILTEFFQYNFQSFVLPIGLSVNISSDLIPSYANACPRGALMSTNVDLSDICVFRI